MTDPLKDLFAQCWEEAVADQGHYSPNYGVEEFTVTGRGPAEYGGKRSIGWWKDHGHEFVQKWVAWRAETDWSFWEYEPGKPAIEMVLNFVLPGDIPVKGAIDRVFVLPSGIMAIVDIKTGRKPETAEQLGLYATGLELLGYPRPDWGYYWDAAKGTHGQPLALDRFTPEFFAHNFATAARGINAGAFLAKAANNCKDWCGVADFCHTVGGSKSQGIDPLAQHLTIATKEKV